jgi:circadian clock protein KaiB
MSQSTGGHDDISKGPATEQPETCILHLYIVGIRPSSLRTLFAIQAICKNDLHGFYTLDVVDMRDHPELLISEQMIPLPALIRKLPRPLRKLVADLTHDERVLVALDLPKKSA